MADELPGVAGADLLQLGRVRLSARARVPRPLPDDVRAFAVFGIQVASDRLVLHRPGGAWRVGSRRKAAHSFVAVALQQPGWRGDGGALFDGADGASRGDALSRSPVRRLLPDDARSIASRSS